MSIKEDFLALIRLGIGHQAVLPAHTIDWGAIHNLAERQGLLAVALDGMESLRNQSPDVVLPEKKALKMWIGEVLQVYEQQYKLYVRAISEMARFYNSNGFKMMVLKGYACGIDWPKPDHRPCGDIDIWLFGKQKEADALLEKRGVTVDTSHHHHTVFYWRDIMVENHYDFINIHSRKSNRELEKTFKALGQDDSHFVELSGERVYIPSPNLHALFLIRHLAAHFTSTSISLRQVLDWAFFVEKHGIDVDWNWLEGVLEENHIKEFFDCINSICVIDLGFASDGFPSSQIDSDLKERVLADILEPMFEAEEPSQLFKRLIYKYRRWQGNAWKQKLCYKESRWSAFWTGLWSHTVKPNSI